MDSLKPNLNTTDAKAARILERIEKKNTALASLRQELAASQAALAASKAENTSLRSRVSLLTSSAGRSAGAASASSGLTLDLADLAAPNTAGAAAAARVPSPLPARYLVAAGDDWHWNAHNELIKSINQAKDRLSRNPFLDVHIYNAKDALFAFYCQCLTSKIIDTDTFKKLTTLNRSFTVNEHNYTLKTQEGKREELVAGFTQNLERQTTLLKAAIAAMSPQTDDLRKAVLLTIENYIEQCKRRAEQIKLGQRPFSLLTSSAGRSAGAASASSGLTLDLADLAAPNTAGAAAAARVPSPLPARYLVAAGDDLHWNAHNELIKSINQAKDRLSRNPFLDVHIYNAKDALFAFYCQCLTSKIIDTDTFKKLTTLNCSFTVNEHNYTLKTQEGKRKELVAGFTQNLERQITLLKAAIAAMSPQTDDLRKAVLLTIENYIEQCKLRAEQIKLGQRP